MPITTIQLIVKNGALFLPIGGCDGHFEHDRDRTSPVLYQAPSGKFESVGFPLADKEGGVCGEVTLALALRDEFICNPFLSPGNVIRLPDGTVFDFVGMLAAHFRGREAVALRRYVTDLSGVPILRTNLPPNSPSLDPVHREMCRVWTLIRANTQLCTFETRCLRQRLLSELNAYEVWQRRYASHLGEPVRWAPQAPPASELTLPNADQFVALPPERRPTIHVYADSIGFTYRIHRPRIDGVPIGIASPLIPEEVKPYLVDWRQEFRRLDWYDPSHDDPGTMWVALDIGGMSIAGAIKHFVGEAARVIYSKPHMDPFFSYESYREIHSTGEVVVLERR